MVYGLVVIAVVVYIAAGGRLRMARLRLLRLRADCDFVLRRRGLSCGLLSLRRCCCRRRLGRRIDCINRLNWIAHGFYLTPLTSTEGQLPLARVNEKARRNAKRPERKQKRLVRYGRRALFSLYALIRVWRLSAGLFFRGGCGESLLHSAGEVRHNPQNALDQHQ